MTKPPFLLSTAILFLALTSQAAELPRVITQSGVQGGLAVWIGCSQHDEMEALGRHGRFLVQALSNDPDAVRKAQAKDLGAKVWVSSFNGQRLPFADNMINLFVADAECKVPMPEIMRALVPRGVALVNGKKTVKPVPPDIDEWTHHLHDPSGNAVGASGSALEIENRDCG